jgi:hypothetical protein
MASLSCSGTVTYERDIPATSANNVVFIRMLDKLPTQMT